MNKYRLGLFVPLLFVIILTGCAAAVGNPQSTAEALQPLTATEWPTSPPASPPASPTPFPKITPEPTTTPAAGPAEVATPGVVTTTESSLGNGTQALMAQASPAGSQLTPFAVGLVTTEQVTVRQGPGTSYGAVGTARRGDLAAVFGRNQAGDWLYGLTISQVQGWLPADAVRVTGNLAEAPVLPNQPLSTRPPASKPAVIEATASAGPHNNSPLPAAVGTQSAPALNDLVPLATARINRSEVQLRPQPDTDAAPIDQITDNQEKLSILGVDQSRQWALVQPAFSHLGWVALSQISVKGALADAPPLVTAWVDSNQVQVWRGPGIYNDAVGTLAINSLVRVLGLDQSRSWALIKPIPGGGLGWVPTQFLTVGARLADLPAAPKLSLPAQNAPAAAPAVQGRPIDESKLVFQLASGGDIMVINPAGSGLRRLTSGIDPVLSPDGQTVAFTRWQGETGSLWLINIDGTNERQVVGFIKQAKGPAWSPDGAQIVLNFQHEGQLQPETTCETLRKNGHSPRPPANAHDVEIKIDNRQPRLCWTMPPDPHWGLRVVNIANGSFEDLNGGQYAFRPSWDPTQPSRIVDDAGDGLWTIDINGQNHSNLTNDIDDGSPVFSPDGRYLAVTHGQQGGNQGYDIFRLNQDGSGRVRLTQTPLWVPVTPDGNHKQWNNVAPTWSPDGSQIAFLTDRTGRWEIWLMNADGSNQHPLFSDAINNRLHFTYNFVDEQMLSWH